MAEYATVEKVEIVGVVLTLDKEEAGYLLDMLLAHVGGELTFDGEPLGRIREALKESGIKRLHAKNTNSGRYASLHR